MVPVPKRNLLNVSVYDAGNAVPHQSLAAQSTMMLPISFCFGGFDLRVLRVSV